MYLIPMDDLGLPRFEVTLLSDSLLRQVGILPCHSLIILFFSISNFLTCLCNFQSSCNLYLYTLFGGLFGCVKAVHSISPMSEIESFEIFSLSSL
ncbi:unnamed protein product [Moneuplotes crassus]|uniref:Uncharacterized protein n=1 Tax=Euplotes crassus TaxID=5936 RepID=A0AAD1XLP4_EUPCR|nr:unnamed protein product [Moneuplotes crassus]